MYLKPEVVGIIPRAGYVRGIVSLLKVFNGWRISMSPSTSIMTTSNHI